MKTLKKTLPISSFLLHSSTTHKPFSSSSTSILFSNLKPLLPSSDPLISQKPFSKDSVSDDPKIANLQILISQNHQNVTNLSQSSVVNVLLSLKDQPLSARKYFNWAEKQSGFNGGFESFCVLFHILAGANLTNKKKFVKDLVSSQQCPDDAATVIQGLMESAKRFEFRIKPRVFEFLLNGFVSAKRIDDAIVCFHFMIENWGAKVGPSFANFLLRRLISRNMFKEVEELVNKMISRGVIIMDAQVIIILLESCCTKRKFEEAEQLFRNVRDMGLPLGAKAYSCAVGAVSKKPDSNAACELLKDMRDKGWVPSSSTFKNVIKACLLQRNMAEAVRVKDEMISCGKRMDWVIATSLMKGYCELGDMKSALSLFTKGLEDGLPPKRFIFLLLMEGYCNKGDMEGACELYNLMIIMGISPEIYTTFVFIKGLLNAQLCAKACEQLGMAFKSCLVNEISFNFLMSWLCAEGKVDEARQLCDKIVETGSIPTVVSNEKNIGSSDNMSGQGFIPNAVTYTILMEGYFKMGKVEQAFKVYDEMVSQRIVCVPYTYNTIIHGLCYNGQTSQARKMLEKFTEGGNFKPSFTTYNFIIDGFTKEGNLDSASSVYTEMSEKGVSQDFTSRIKLVEKLCKSNKLERALELLKEMVNQGFELNVSAYEALIGGFCRRGSMRTALNLYSELLHAGLPPSQYMLVCIVRGFKFPSKKC